MRYVSIRQAVAMMFFEGTDYEDIDRALGLVRGCSCLLHRYGKYIDAEQRLRQRLYLKVWSAIRRCTDESYKHYYRYGGRGIRVHPPWIANPPEFVAYLATLRGHDDETLWLDRVDNDGHYEPGNLRFVTPFESGQNRKQTYKHSTED